MNLIPFTTGVVTVAPSPALSGTSMTVAMATGHALPTPAFFALVVPPGVGQLVAPFSTEGEICLVTANTAGVLTIVRAELGSPAVGIGVGWTIAAMALPVVVSVSGVIGTTLTTMATTAIFNPGFYFVQTVLTIKPTSTSTTTVEAEWVAGTATAAFLGQTSGQVGINNLGALTRNIAQLSINGCVNITVAGTLLLQAIATGATASVLASTDTNTLPRASGYTVWQTT